MKKMGKINFTMSASSILFCILLCCSSLTVNAADTTDVLIRHYENVLGTSMDVTVYGGESASLEPAVDTTLAEIARLEQILSTWREDSEIMMLIRDRSTSLAPCPSPLALLAVVVCGLPVRSVVVADASD